MLSTILSTQICRIFWPQKIYNVERHKKTGCNSAVVFGRPGFLLLGSVQLRATLGILPLRILRTCPSHLGPQRLKYIYILYLLSLISTLLSRQYLQQKSQIVVHDYMCINNLEFAYSSSNHISCVSNILNKEPRNCIFTLHINLNY